MSKGLVTKFNGIYDNADADKLNVYRIPIRPDDNYSETNAYFSVKGTDLTVKAVGGVIATSFAGLNDGVETITPTSVTRTSIYYTKNNYYIEIYSKYDITEILADSSYAEQNVDKLAFCSLVNFRTYNAHSTGDLYNLRSSAGTLKLLVVNSTNNIHGDVSAFSGSGLVEVGMANCNGSIYGDVTAFANASLERIDMSKKNGYSGADIYGNVAAFGNCPRLASLRLLRTKVNGSIENLVANFIAGGKATSAGDLRLFIARTDITFGSGKLSDVYNVEVNLYLHWESSSVIYLTVYTASVESATLIIAEGVDASRIAEWENAGKTVIVVS